MSRIELSLNSVSIKRGDKDLALTAEIGGKAKGLLSLVKMGYPTPTFYLLSHKFILKHEESAKSINDLLIEWTNNYAIDSTKLWAVRSSAAQEDGQHKSFAGQYFTALNVSYEELEEAILKVADSFQKTDNYKDITQSYSIIIQEMIPAAYAGVLFTADPTNILSNETVIEIVPGLGNKLVNGEVEGLRITTKGETLIFGDLDATYGADENQELGNEIRANIEKSLSSVVEAATSAEQKSEYPLDIEFVLYQNKIYWLQVRPITNRPQLENYTVWDKTAAETSYPDITLPLSASYNTRTLEFAYHGVDKAIGYAKRILAQNKAYISQMSGEINGRLYYNVTAWQAIIYQMPFGKKISAQLPTIWGMNPLPFPKPNLRHSFFERTAIGIRTFLMMQRISRYDAEYQTATQAIINAPVLKNLAQLSHQELIIAYKAIETQLEGQWFAPMSTGFYAMIYYNRLKKKIARTTISEKHPNFLNDILMQDGSVVSVEIVREFQNLLKEIHLNKKLLALLNSEPTAVVYQQIKTEYPTFYSKIQNYIKAYGCRASSSELKMETITYREDPLAFISTLQVNIQNYVPSEVTTQAVAYKRILKEAYPYQLLKRKRLEKLIEKTVTKTKARENYRFMRTETFAVVRQLFLAMGNSLFATKQIDAPRDVLYLTFAQLMSVDSAKNYRDLIKEAKVRYAQFDPEDDIIRFVKNNNVLHPISEKIQTTEQGTLSGVGCCSGIASGKVKIIESMADLQQDFNGCIVIAKFFEPGWINVFSQASGIVSERGNLLSHTSIISRELGIPSIVGVKGIIAASRNLDSIKINGTKGIVYL